MKKYLDLGAGGVQVGTKFVATHECDAHDNFKQTYINAKEEDIRIVKSPVGLPGRAIKNKFIDTILCSILMKCYNCLVPCNQRIHLIVFQSVLINAVKEMWMMLYYSVGQMHIK